MTRRGGFLALLAAVLLARHVLAAPPQGAASGACDRQRARQRQAWDVRAPARAQPSLSDGARVWHWPTIALGTWVVETVSADGAELTRVAPGEITRVVFDARCAPSTRVESRAPVDGPRFADADLAARVQSGRRGVIHVWSPHMPLSVDAIGPLTTAARAEALAVDLVLDPAADHAFAARIAAERGLPAASLRVADSVELLFRDALVHAPSVIVYARGAIAGSVYPGGHTVEEYAAYFTRVLAER